MFFKGGFVQYKALMLNFDRRGLFYMVLMMTIKSQSQHKQYLKTINQLPHHCLLTSDIIGLFFSNLAKLTIVDVISHKYRH